MYGNFFAPSSTLDGGTLEGSSLVGGTLDGGVGSTALDGSAAVLDGGALDAAVRNVVSAPAPECLP